MKRLIYFVPILLIGIQALAQSNSTETAVSESGDIYVGVDYYPEHWQEERWETDIKLMKEAGFNIVRLAEFSWVKMEPIEGVFDFEWLDKAVNLCAVYDIDVILCTPTAVMPAWMARNYPDAMREDVKWGMRKGNSFSDPGYDYFSERITRKMAEHYVDFPNVVGWQTDNEFSVNHEDDEMTRQDFITWLRKKYKTPGNLNKAWGTHFWGHSISIWNEIFIPNDASIHNPSAVLDYYRYSSDAVVDFQKAQIDILREVCPDDFITHNFMGLHDKIDYYDLARDIDFVSWDNYPVKDKPEINYGAALSADVMRGLKKKNFWIMEQTAGPAGWGNFNRNPYPGEIRMVAYQQMAHGADAQVWFRWRTSTAGREQYWHGLLGHDGKPMRRYEEAKQVASEYQKVFKSIKGTTVKPEIAIIYDYDNIWATQIQPGFKNNSYLGRLWNYYIPLFDMGHNVDIISRNDDLSEYKLVIASNLYLMPDDVAEKLENYVRQGGVLLTDCRTGVKDENSLVYPRTLPGKLSQTLGISIPEYESMNDYTFELSGTDDFPGDFTAYHYADWIIPGKADILMNYKDEWHLKDYVALTRNEFGKGRAWYLGTLVKEGIFYTELMTELLKDADIKVPLEPVYGVEISYRQSENKKFAFLINQTEEVKTIKVPEGKKELITGDIIGEEIELDVFGVAIIELQ